MVVFCVVFSSPLKIFTNIVDDDLKKETIQLLEEEEKDLKENQKNEQELFSYSDIKTNKTLIQKHNSNTRIASKVQVNYLSPFFKVHTHPPDFSF